MDGITAFHARFGAPPLFRVVVPGRVNLMGDHIDYCGLPVLPAAIQKRLTLLVRPRSDTRVTIAPVEPSFGERSFETGGDPAPFDQGDWGNYATAAVAGSGIARPVGFDAVLESGIPVAAGLSSSSALVVAVALALIESAGQSVSPIDLAGRLAVAERHVGTQGGGMDQAIVLAAVTGCAGHIDFHPLHLTPVPVPPDWRFIVAHSGVAAEKSGAARAAYNERASDVRKALGSVAHSLDVPGATWPELMERFDLQSLEAAAGNALEGRERDRFLHVASEATRVDRAVTAMYRADGAGFGRLMRESHASLRDRFSVSLPELDALVSAFERGGAMGARLTGAGFGGCVVALARPADTDRLLELVGRASRRGSGSGPAPVEPFVVEPSAGAHCERLVEPA